MGAQADRKWENTLDEGYQLLERGDYPAALSVCRQALAVPGLPLQPKASFYTLNGHALRRSGKLSAAVSSHETALALRDKLFGPTSEEVANCLQNIGNCYWDMGDPARAAVFFQKNLDIRRRRYPPGDTLLVVPLMNLADAKMEQGRVGEAAQLFQQALDLQQQAGGSAEMAANLRCDLARCFYKTAQPQRALDTLTNVLSAYSRWPKTPAGTKGECIALMGQCLLDLGDYEAAFRRFRQAFGLLDADPAGRAGVRLHMGRLLRYRFQLEEAIETLSMAVSECGQSPDSLRLRPLSAAIWLEMGTCYMDFGENTAALHYLGKASKLAKSPDLAVAVQLKLGACLTKKGDFAAAARVLEEALRRAAAARDLPKQFAARQRLGDLSLRQQELASALRHYGAAMQLLEQKTAPPADAFFYEKLQGHAALAAAGKAQALKTGKQADWQAVSAQALAGISLLEQWKGRLIDDRSEADAQAAFYQLYSLAIEACGALRKPGHAQEAFALSERYRVQLFRKMAQGGQPAGEAERQRLLEERRLREALALAEKQRADRSAGLLYSLDPGATSRLDSSIQVLTAALARLQDVKKGQVPLTTPAALRATLRPGQTFVQYQWGEGGQLFAFVASADTFLMASLALPDALEKDVLAFFGLCNQNPDWLPDASPDSLPVLGYRLYQSLLAPLAPWLGSELVIVPDAWLCYLPFDALLTQAAAKGQPWWEHAYLVREKSIGHAWSASLYVALKKRPASARAGGLLAFAPAFEGGQLSALKHNVEEAHMASRLFGGRLVKNGEAREAAFRQLAARHRVLYLATHGVLDDREAAWSYLAFTELADSTENELLYAWEVPGLGLDADLVVLSACQTANGRMHRGEGLMSLARAFQLAGAKTVVASLWNVDDKETPGLMAAFLKGIVGKMPKTQALSAAKRHYLQTAPRLKTHPFYWSGFVASGDDGPVEVASGMAWRWYLIGFAATALLVGGVGWWRRRYFRP